MTKILLITVFFCVSSLLIEVSSDDDTVEQTSKLLTNETFEDDIQSGLAFVLFYVNWCAHSRKLFPLWNQLDDKYKDHDVIKIRRVDCEKESKNDLCFKQKVNGVPTLNIYKEGYYIREYEGGTTFDELVDGIESHLSYEGKKDL
jgi:thioredoxin-like negative regulator of GroEL